MYCVEWIFVRFIPVDVRSCQSRGCDTDTRIATKLSPVDVRSCRSRGCDTDTRIATKLSPVDVRSCRSRGCDTDTRIATKLSPVDVRSCRSRGCDTDTRIATSSPSYLSPAPPCRTWWRHWVRLRVGSRRGSVGNWSVACDGPSLTCICDSPSPSASAGRTGRPCHDPQSPG